MSACHAPSYLARAQFLLTTFDLQDARPRAFFVKNLEARLAEPSELGA